MELYSKLNKEKIADAKVLDKILKEVFNGNKSHHMSHLNNIEIWGGITASYFEFENDINTLLGDEMLVKANHNGINVVSMSPKGLGIASKIEKRGYEFLIKEQIRKDFKNEIILYVTILGLIIGIVALVK